MMLSHHIIHPAPSTAGFLTPADGRGGGSACNLNIGRLRQGDYHKLEASMAAQ